MDIESIPLIREIKQKTTYPLSEETIKKYFSSFFVFSNDKEAMEEALLRIEPAIEKTNSLLAKKDFTYEEDNILRTLQILREMPQSLQNNLTYYQEILNFQKEFAQNIVVLLNKIPQLKLDEQNECGQQLERHFQILLRSQDFYFNSKDIINEAHLNHIRGLMDSLEKGYLFHFSVGEELNKVPFSAVKLRLPPDKLNEAEAITQEVVVIKRGIEQAYQLNMRMVHWAIHLFSYVKWLSSK
ncbi:hypothetical protein HYT51_02285 [Candidatus Woesearchaeota archaeon]|nr:hypothetical protein [Candidatus Woesearchaeota archaeon]